MSSETQNVIGILCDSFKRQFDVYRELRDSARASMSKLILSRGDVGVLMAGVDKKSRLLEKIAAERESVAGQIQYWQDNRDGLVGNREAIELNEILSQTETVIKEFLEEEEKLKQYMEKILSRGDGAS